MSHVQCKSRPECPAIVHHVSRPALQDAMKIARPIHPLDLTTGIMAITTVVTIRTEAITALVATHHHVVPRTRATSTETSTRKTIHLNSALMRALLTTTSTRAKDRSPRLVPLRAKRVRIRSPVDSKTSRGLSGLFFCISIIDSKFI